MTISSRTPEGRPNRCPVCRRRLKLSPSWPSADAPCPRCGSLVWFPTGHTSRTTTEPATEPDFSLDDFRKQLNLQLRLFRLGQAGELLAGLSKGDDRGTGGEDAGQNLRRTLGMIDAMTRKERDRPEILDAPRCRRIAAGAGVQLQEVEQFLSQFQQVRVLLMQMAQMNVWRKFLD
jgi:signal recognition particle GTPase